MKTRVYLMALSFPMIAIASNFFQSNLLEYVAISLYWFIGIVSFLCLLTSDLLRRLREPKTINRIVFSVIMFALNVYVYYIGFTYTIMMVMLLSALQYVIAKSSFKGIFDLDAYLNDKRCLNPENRIPE